MNVKTILFASLLFACGKDGDGKPAKKYFDNVSSIESLGFTIDRPAGVKLGEVRSSTPHDRECCKEVELQGPDGSFLGRLYTLNVPHHYKTLDEYTKSVHAGNTVVKKEVLPSGAFYVEYREPHDSPKSPVRIQVAVTTATSSADCYVTPFEEELDMARALCRSFRPVAASSSAAVTKPSGG